MKSTKKKPSRMGDRRLISKAVERAKKMNEKVLKHIGITSSKEERIAKLNELREKRRRENKYKKRMRGKKPQFAFQAGDVLARKELRTTLSQFATFSDTVTLEKDIDENGEEDQSKPRNVGLMMILNEVAETSVNGGGAREKCKAKRSKPEFFSSF